MADRLSRDKRSKLMSRVKRRDTSPEITVRSALHRAGFRFRTHVVNLPGKPDIVLKRYRTVIFVHGCFWHGHDCKKGALPSSNVEFWKAKLEGNRERDERNRSELEKEGWRVLIIWECKLMADLSHTLELLSTEKPPN